MPGAVLESWREAGIEVTITCVDAQLMVATSVPGGCVRVSARCEESSAQRWAHAAARAGAAPSLPQAMVPFLREQQSRSRTTAETPPTWLRNLL